MAAILRHGAMLGWTAEYFGGDSQNIAGMFFTQLCTPSPNKLRGRRGKANPTKKLPRSAVCGRGRRGTIQGERHGISSARHSALYVLQCFLLLRPMQRFCPMKIGHISGMTVYPSIITIKFVSKVRGQLCDSRK